MTTVNYLDVVRGLSAELILAVTALLALTIDLSVLRRAERAVRTKSVGTLAVIGLLAALIPLFQMYGDAPQTLLGGTLVVNDLTVIFKIVVVVLTALAVLISLDYDVGRHVGEYFATMLFGAIGMLLLVGTEELITIFVALELTSICLYILTAFHKSWLRSQEAALKYFMFGAISSAFLLFGLSYIFGIAGTTNLRAIHEVVLTDSPLFSVGLLFVIIGFGFKVAVVPFHLWAPDAYEGAPTPVAAYIATGSKVASFFVLTKVLLIGFTGAEGSAFWGSFQSGWAMLLAVTGTLSMVVGNCAAIVQHNIKRLLAYSSIAHAGYIFIGLIAATVTGTTSVLFYVIVYALTNLGAFGVLAALSARAGGEDLEHFNGMSKRAPYLSLLMLIFILSLAGVPPLGGFFSKFYLFAAAVGRDAENFGLLWLVVIGIFMSAVSLYYYLIVLKHMYIVEPRDPSRITTPVYLNVALGLAALGVVLLGVFPQPLLALLNSLAARL